MRRVVLSAQQICVLECKGYRHFLSLSNDADPENRPSRDGLGRVKRQLSTNRTRGANVAQHFAGNSSSYLWFRGR